MLPLTPSAFIATCTSAEPGVVGQLPALVTKIAALFWQEPLGRVQVILAIWLQSLTDSAKGEWVVSFCPSTWMFMMFVCANAADEPVMRNAIASRDILLGESKGGAWKKEQIRQSFQVLASKSCAKSSARIDGHLPICQELGGRAAFSGGESLM